MSLSNQALSPEEQRLLKMYGKLPSRSDLLNRKLKDRKYFDSGDYALSQAGKTSHYASVGSEHPYPEDIPSTTTASQVQTHNKSPSPNSKTSPIIGGSPPKFALDDVNYQSSCSNTPGTVPLMSPGRRHSSSLAPPDAEAARIRAYHQRLAQHLNH
ncbi:hypothetical protein TRVA0_061S00408 [Trichomonascus vanleenenianus]|uniref:uncharacterized protein n=1 Tax=Trichomonascus vanleenenianus TaxID=2268995 RepID=UPI003ECB0465